MNRLVPDPSQMAKMLDLIPRHLTLEEEFIEKTCFYRLLHSRGTEKLQGVLDNSRANTDSELYLESGRKICSKLEKSKFRVFKDGSSFETVRILHFARFLPMSGKEEMIFLSLPFVGMCFCFYSFA